MEKFQVFRRSNDSNLIEVEGKFLLEFDKYKMKLFYYRKNTNRFEIVEKRTGLKICDATILRAAKEEAHKRLKSRKTRKLALSSIDNHIDRYGELNITKFEVDGYAYIENDYEWIGEKYHHLQKWYINEFGYGSWFDKDERKSILCGVLILVKLKEKEGTGIRYNEWLENKHKLTPYQFKRWVVNQIQNAKERFDY